MDELDSDTLEGLKAAGLLDEDTYSKLYARGSQKVDEIAYNLADKGVGPKELMEALTPSVIQAESSGRADAVSPKGATGLMQLMPATAAEVAGKLGMKNYDLKNPEDNKRLGQAYLSQMLEKYKGDPELATAAYNAGPGTVDRALAKTGGSTFQEIAQALPEETRNYVAKVVGGAPEPSSAPTPEPTPTLPPEGSPMPQEGPSVVRPYDTPPMPLPGATAQPTPTEAPLYPAPSQPAPEQLAVAQPTPEQADAQNAQLADQTAQVSLANANQAAQNGDPQTTLDSLAATQQASGLSNAFAMQIAGSQQEAAAKANGFAQQSQLLDQRAQQVAATGADFSAQREAAQRQTKADLDTYREKVASYSKASVNPDHLFQSQSTFATIMLGIGAALQAAGGDTQSGLKLIDDAIARDINVQKANIDIKGQDVNNSHNLMNQNQAYLKDINDAEAAAQSQQLQYTQALVQKAVANTQSEVAKANGEALLGQLKERQVNLEIKLEKSRGDKAAQNALAALSIPGLSEAQKKIQQLAIEDKQFRPLMISDSRGAPLGFAKTPIDAKDFQASLEARNVIKSEIQNVRDLYEKEGTPIGDKDARTKMNASIGILRQKVIQAQDRGLRGFSKEMVNNLDKLLPPDLFPSNWASASAKSVERIAYPNYVKTVLGTFENYYDKQFLDAMKDGILIPTPELNQMLGVASAKAGQTAGIKPR